MKKLLFSIIILCLSAAQVIAADYYWVGGTGNWSDYASHWATTSGGAIFHTQVPTLNDNVFFNASSFTSGGAIVTIDVDANCASMDWTGATTNPQLTGAAARMLNIYGSLTLINEMDYNYQGPVTFRSSSFGNTITMAGKDYLNNVAFDGIGSWTLQDAMTLSSLDLYLVNGTLNTNGQDVSMRQFRSEYTSNRTLNLGSSTFTCWYGSSEAWKSNGTNFTVNPGTSKIVFPSNGGGIYNYSAPINLYDVEYTSTSHTGYYQSLGTAHNITFYAVGYMANSYGTINKVTVAGHCDLIHGSFTINEMICNSTATIHQGNNTIGTLEITGNASIAGNNQFGTLELSPGKTYTFQSGTTQTFVIDLIANGTCSEAITIQSTSSGSQATFSKAAGIVTINRVNLKDNNATGGAAFVANNCNDLGNNLGWTINALAGQDLYWIGNAGNWDDGSHWSLSSGGGPSYCVPTELDNLFFDANSFTLPGQVVSVNIANAGCTDMYWSGVNNNPAFSTSSSSYNLRINGSLTLSPNMNFSFNGITYFEGETPAKSSYAITMAGKLFNNAVYFNGAGGVWTLQDNLTVNNNDLYLNKGTLSTNDNNVECRRFISATSDARSLTLGSSLVSLSSNSNQAWYVTGSNMSIAPGSSEIMFTSGGAGLWSQTPAALNYNDVTFEGTTGASSLSGSGIFGKVIFSGNGTINGDHIYNTLIFSPGKSYTLESGKTQTVLNKFHAWVNDGSQINMQASTSGSQATISKSLGTVWANRLQLKDMEATGGATFNVYNGTDLGNNTGWNFLGPTNYSQVGNITVANGQTECFEATEIITVGGSGKTFIVQNGGTANLIAGYKVQLLPGVRVFSGGTLHARISQYGEFCELEESLLAALENYASEFLIEQAESDYFIIYPNPTSGSFKAQSSMFNVEKGTIEVLDFNGKVMFSSNLEPGTLNLELNLSHLAPGIYFFRVQTENNTWVKKLIKL